MRTDYGVRALIDLAQHDGQGPVQCAEIAQRQMVPEPFLDQVLSVLRKAGLVRSTRGPKGGHVLAREAAGITMLDVVRALEGSLSPVAYLDEPGDHSQHTHAI